MVRAAARAGAHAVKFQAFKTRNFIHRANPSYKELLAEETPFPLLKELAPLAHDLGLAFGITVFDEEGVELAANIGADFIKISSGDLTFHALIRAASLSGLPLALSTGASREREVEAALKVLSEAQKKPWSVLQCASLYPAPPESANLAVMDRWLKEKKPAGFSDHTPGVEGALAAISLGAKVLEKHFTTSKSLPGGDNFMSLEPSEAEELLKKARLGKAPGALPEEIRKSPYWGSDAKKPWPGERPDLIRRAAVASRFLAKGKVLKVTDAIFQRVAPPERGTLVRPDSLWENRALTRSYAAGEPLLAEELSPL
jgi:sialic acid synthase SpsE